MHLFIIVALASCRAVEKRMGHDMARHHFVGADCRRSIRRFHPRFRTRLPYLPLLTSPPSNHDPSTNDAPQTGRLVGQLHPSLRWHLGVHGDIALSNVSWLALKPGPHHGHPGRRCGSCKRNGNTDVAVCQESL